MKKLSFLFILSILFSSLTLSAQYGYDDDFYDEDLYPGYLGDNFSLEGALEIFKNSRSVEDFEYRINNRDNYVNNLDLNNDGRTDFVRVTDQSNDRNYRLLVMQAVLGRKDVQDIAVIAIEKTGRRNASLQIIGDEYLFGPNMILEPNDIAYNQDRRGYGPSGDLEFRRGFINVYYWPSVRNLFRARYSYYRSPYYWGYYPRVWNPWRPFFYNNYYNRCGIYRTGFYRTVPSVRIVYVNNYYRPNRRTYSPWIRDRYNRCAPIYRRDRLRSGAQFRGISQTPPTRRRDYDDKRGIRQERRFERGTIGNNSGRNSEIRNERGTVSRGSKVNRGDYFTDRGTSKGSTKRATNSAAPSRPERSVTKSQRSNSSVRSERGTGIYKSDRKVTSKPSKRSSSYSNDRKTSTRPSRSSSSYKRDRRSSTAKPSRSTATKPNRSSSIKSNRKTSTRPSKSSSSNKSSRRPSSIKSNRSSSSSRKSSSIKSTPKRSTPKSSSRSSKSNSSNFKSKRSTSRSKRGN